MAALPTDFMVIAENQYGNMAPTKRKANVIGCRISTLVSYTGHTDREGERKRHQEGQRDGPIGGFLLVLLGGMALRMRTTKAP